MNLRELKEIFRLVEKTDFTEVEVVQGDLRIRIERGKSHHPMMAVHPQAVSAAHAPVFSAPQAEAAATVEETPRQDSGTGQYVTSPFVGTFYRSPSPDADPYVQVGQTVRKGQVLCIVEAMKLMNEIESDFDGKVAEVYAENGKPVEFGEKLFRIEPNS